jgi:hypothetical protein
MELLQIMGTPSQRKQALCTVSASAAAFPVKYHIKAITEIGVLLSVV